MMSTRALKKLVLIAFCLPLLAACGADSNPVGVNAVPSDPGVQTLHADWSGPGSGQHEADHSLLECEALRHEDSDCAERYELEIR